MNKKNSNLYYSKDFIKNFTLIFFSLILVMFALTFFIVKNNKDKELFAIKTTEVSTLAYFTRIISTQFKLISSDLFILSESEPIKDCLISENYDDIYNAKKTVSIVC